MSRPELDEPPRLHGHLHSGVAPNLMSGTEEDAILARPGVYSLRAFTVPLIGLPNDMTTTTVQPMVILLILFLCCTGVVVYLVSTIPVLSLPHNLREVLDQAIALKHYSRTSFAASLHVLFVLSTLFVYKQAFSIPGSLLSNCLFGSLYGVTVSTLLTSVLTAIGSMGCVSYAC